MDRPFLVGILLLKKVEFNEVTKSKWSLSHIIIPFFSQLRLNENQIFRKVFVMERVHALEPHTTCIKRSKLHQQ